MGFWLDLASFAAKSLWLVLMVGAGAALIAIVIYIARRGGEDEDEEKLKIVSLNHRYENMEDDLAGAVLPVAQLKARAKQMKAQQKQEKKAPPDERPRIFVLDFSGESKSFSLELLGRKISGVLSIARPDKDEVLIRIESPGGSVTAYGLAAAQLLRFGKAGVRLTAAVDQVAASGGYMMAVAAQKIIAAPFAVVGSIGVVAPAPNLSRLLKKHDIDYEDMTAGEFKRPMSLLGQPTEEGRAHMQQKLDAMHDAFKNFVGAHRAKADMARAANGDFWYGQEALELGLIDEILTSDEYLFSRREEAMILSLEFEARQTFIAQLLENFGFFGRSAKIWIGRFANGVTM